MGRTNQGVRPIISLSQNHRYMAGDEKGNEISDLHSRLYAVRTVDPPRRSNPKISRKASEEVAS